MSAPVIGPWPDFDAEMVEAAVRVLRSGKVNYWMGEEGRSFEREFAEYLGVPHAVALANGSLALEAALHALDIGPGDEVVVTPRTFVASASCAVLCGATPVFADVDRDSQNVTAETIRTVLTSRTRAIIAVHLAGRACEMDPILELARERKLRVIEDVAQACGGTYRGRPLGTLGDVGCFSFCQDKILTTAGEGGMAVTRDARIWERLWAWKDHGKSYEASFKREHPPGFRWLHESFGTNARMTEVQSAVGRVALRRLPSWLASRARRSDILAEALGKVECLRVPAVPAHVGHAYYKFYAFVRPERLKADWSRDRIVEEVSKAGVPCFTGSCGEVYLEKAFEVAGLRPARRLPVARELGETSLMFLVHPTISETAEIESATLVAGVAHAARRS
ncbi:MAG TPA: DegT/DnrJ/EryC1/StrS aminotransferase family protein [Planctomycetota bacterium]|nr:DegT/DnrJ/EryC1/StrS aminotransferase family protein [Planctomycetota bacterium]